MKTAAKTQPHSHAAPAQFWLEKAWPEGAAVMAKLRETATADGAIDAKTKAMIKLACVSLQRCKHCLGNTVAALKSEHGVTDRQIAEIMMVASYTGAGTNMAWAKEVFDEQLG